MPREVRARSLSFHPLFACVVVSLSVHFNSWPCLPGGDLQGGRGGGGSQRRGFTAAVFLFILLVLPAGKISLRLSLSVSFTLTCTHTCTHSLPQHLVRNTDVRQSGLNMVKKKNKTRILARKTEAKCRRRKNFQTSCDKTVENKPRRAPDGGAVARPPQISDKFSHLLPVMASLLYNGSARLKSLLLVGSGEGGDEIQTSTCCTSQPCRQSEAAGRIQRALRWFLFRMPRRGDGSSPAAEDEEGGETLHLRH